MIHFVHPHMLFGWLVLFPIALLALGNRRRRPHSFSRRNSVLFSLALFFCIFGLSRPQWGHVSTQTEAGRSQLILVVDISKSMLAKDITPSRLDFAVAFASQLIQRLGSTKVALFPFALDGYMQVPFTSDTAAIIDMLASLNPNDVTNQGTDLSRVLETLYKHLARMEASAQANSGEWVPTQVLLLSDGESHYPIRDNVSELFNKKHIPIFTVGIGSAEGAAIPSERSGYNQSQNIRDRQGANVITKLHAETLRRISDHSGGDYYAAKFEEIDRLAKRIEQSMQMGRLTNSFQVEKEYYAQCFFLAFLLFLLEFSMGRWEYAIRSLLLAALLTGTLLCHSARAADTISDTTETDNAALDDETRASKAYNNGVDQIKQNGLLKAAEFFQESALLTTNPVLKKKSLYNLADVLLKQGDPQQALDAFQQAFEIKSGEADFEKDVNKKISENMSLAYQILQRLKKQPSQGGEGKNGSNDEDGKQGSSAQDNKGPKKFRSQNFSDDEKKKIYDLVASEEQESLQRIQAQRSQGQTKNTTDKPW